ncbi:MAG: ACP S-malonyltransferase, partial [Clostridia bacterium]|nr:ACP S-malonyltransferase [Clostridia bacterium]
KEVSFAKPEISVFANLTGGLYPDDPAEYAGILAAQIKSPVRWTDEIRAMIADGADTFVECGPGRTLCGLIRKIDKSVTVLQVENEETLRAAVQALRG